VKVDDDVFFLDVRTHGRRTAQGTIGNGCPTTDHVSRP